MIKAENIPDDVIAKMHCNWINENISKIKSVLDGEKVGYIWASATLNYIEQIRISLNELECYFNEIANG